MRLDSQSCSADDSVVDCENVFYLVDDGDDKDEFYGSAAPSENIWNKFELETPPRSPIAITLCDDYDDWCDQNSFSLRSKLIQDCMWSGQTAAVCDGSQGTAPRSDRLRKESFDLSTAPVAAATGTAVVAAAAADCVDPTAVFPYPLNREHSYSMMTPAPSDSEDEIDVVGVGENTRIRIPPVRRPQQPAGVSSYQQPLQQPSKVTAVAAATDGGTIIVDVNHNRLSTAVAERLLSSQKRPLRVGSNNSTAAVGLHHYHNHCKRARRHMHQQHHSPPSSSSSHASSDSEDFDGKRSMHNVLERKRRNDLKSSFFLLRDHVPELRHQERAAKVVILAKATEYTRRLRQEEVSLLAELGVEKQRQARLLEQLERHRTSRYND